MEIEKCNEEVPFRELIGAFMYLIMSVATRPNIKHMFNLLSQFDNCYSHGHWFEAKRIHRYLQKILNYDFIFK